MSLADVIADDINVVVLRLQFKHGSLLGDGSIYMESPLHQCGVIDIDATLASYYVISKEKFCEEVVHLGVNFC